VAGRLAEGLQLGVAVVEAVGGAEEQGGHLQGVERGDDAVEVVAEHDQVGGVRGDRLGVGREARQVGHRRLGGEVRRAVHGLDLLPGAHGEEHLGRGGRHRHDVLRPLVQGELAVVAGHGDGEVLGGGTRGGLGGVAGGVVAGARRRDQEQGEQQRGGGEPAGDGAGQRRPLGRRQTPPTGPTPDARPLPRGSEHGARQAIWLRSTGDHHSCGTAPGSHRTSLIVRRRLGGRRGNGTSGAADQPRADSTAE
jgi:hypothetical protein